jgi:hypothetical protein
MSLLTGHRPGAFEGFQMKDLFDKERWDRRERQVQNPRFADEGLPPQMTNWYKGRGASEEVNSRNRMDRVMPGTPNTQANAKLFPLRPSLNIQPQKLSAHFRNPFRNPESVATRSNPMKTSYAPYGGEFRQDQMGGGLVAPPLDIEDSVEEINMGRGITPNKLAHLSEYPGQNTMRNLGVYNPIGADTVATEEEVEAMNAYRNQMLTDLLAETSEEPEVKAISYYKKKKKRSPKTYRSKSVGYRLRRS